jgi:type II secretory pathway component PulM
MTANERRLLRLLAWVAVLAAAVLTAFFTYRAIDARLTRLRNLRTELAEWKERERQAAIEVPLSVLNGRIQTLGAEIAKRAPGAGQATADPYALAEALRSAAAGRGLALLSMQVDPARSFIAFSLSGRVAGSMRFMEDLARIAGVLSVEELSVQQSTAAETLLLTGRVAFVHA